MAAGNLDHDSFFQIVFFLESPRDDSVIFKFLLRAAKLESRKIHCL